MSKRIVVVGAGVVGLCTAYYSALEGHEVLVVEREASDHEGCSYGNAGLIVPSHIVPLAAPGMIAAGVFVLVYAWNEFLFAFIFTTTRAKTAPLLLSEMLGAVTGVDWGAVFAAATIQLVPILVFVIAVQKYLIAGLTAGSVKG